MPNETIQQRLLDAAAQDIEELRPQLEPRAAAHAKAAEQQLRQRGEREEKDLRDTLTDHRDRVKAELVRHQRDYTQLIVEFDTEDDQQRKLDTDQLQANMRHWEQRLGQFDEDLQREPRRVREFYEVKVRRVEPVGLVYLWPETN